MKRFICLVSAVLMFLCFSVPAYSARQMTKEESAEIALHEYAAFLETAGLRSVLTRNSKANAYYAYCHAYEVFKEEYDAGRFKSIAMQAALLFLAGSQEYGDQEWSRRQIDDYMNRGGTSGTISLALEELLETKYVRGEDGQPVDGYSAFIFVRKTDYYGSLYTGTNSDGSQYITEIDWATLGKICEKWGGVNARIVNSVLYALDQYLVD